MLDYIKDIQYIINTIQLDRVDFYYYDTDIKSILDIIRYNKKIIVDIPDRAGELVMIYKPYNKLLIVKKGWLLEIAEILTYYKTDLNIVVRKDFNNITSDYIAGTTSQLFNNVIIIDNYAIPYILTNNYRLIIGNTNKRQYFIIVLLNLLFKMRLKNIDLTHDNIKAFLIMLINLYPDYKDVYEQYVIFIQQKPTEQLLIYLKQLIMNNTNYNYKINKLMTDYDYNTQVLNTIQNVINKQDLSYKFKLYTNQYQSVFTDERGSFIYVKFINKELFYYINDKQRLKLYRDDHKIVNKQDDILEDYYKITFKKFKKDAFIRTEYSDFIDFHYNQKEEDDELDYEFFQDELEDNDDDNKNNDSDNRDIKLKDLQIKRDKVYRREYKVDYSIYMD